MPYNTISERYRSAMTIIKTKPKLLWGLSLLGIFIIYVLTALSYSVPILILPITLCISVGICGLYIKTVRGEQIETADIFAAFKDWQTIKRIACGMLWMMLWLMLWALIPIAGIVMVIIKSCEYAFTPYILLTRPEIGAMDALKESKKLTYGIRGRIFGAQVLVYILFGLVILFFALFMYIPAARIPALLIIALIEIAFMLCAPLFLGLVMAGFYEAALNAPPQFRLYDQYLAQQEMRKQYQQQQQQVYEQYRQQQAQQTHQQQYGQPAPQPQYRPAPDQTTAPVSGIAQPGGSASYSAETETSAESETSQQ